MRTVLLPNAPFAEVPVEKLLAYLLDTSHELGRHKARVFRSIGYDLNHLAMLRADLRALALKNEATLDSTTPFGVKWRVSGVIVGPNGRGLRIRTIWIVRVGELVPRFVTAFPTRQA
jgi:hypothetical protein